VKYYLYQKDKQVGLSYTEQQLRDMVKSGVIDHNVFAWRQGLAQWQPLNKIISFTETATTNKEKRQPSFPATLRQRIKVLFE
jgi:hypothetical protein